MSSFCKLLWACCYGFRFLWMLSLFKLESVLGLFMCVFSLCHDLMYVQLGRSSAHLFGSATKQKSTVGTMNLKCCWFLLDWNTTLLLCLVSCCCLTFIRLSLDFAVNRFFMKLLRTRDINIVKSCQSYFFFNLPSVLLKKRAEKFDIKYNKKLSYRRETALQPV